MILDLTKLYKEVFVNTPYKIAGTGSGLDSTPVTYGSVEQNLRDRQSIDYTRKQIALNKKNLYGYDIWHPVEFWVSNKKSIELEACTVGIVLSKTIVETAVSERKGAVIEQFNILNYQFNIRGFLIGKSQFFPEEQIMKLKELHETTEPVSLHGGYPEMFLDESCRVAIINVEFPETQAKAPWLRPFSITCKSDFITDLIIE